MVSKIKSQYNDEIDLLEIVLTIWNNKLKVFLITAVAVVSMFAFLTIKKHTPEYMATTEIRPISIFDELEYKTYNFYFSILSESDKEKKEEIILLPFKNIERSYLINLFIEKLKDNTLFKNAIKKYGLVKKENYKDQQAYEDAVTRLASLINFLPPNNNIKNGSIEPY
tara:strand:- start:135 stop:638 length:504 start_codon:yes stop_codon:yes gene_type:complete